MQPNNQLQRNNPWGFQAQNWSRPMTRGPAPHYDRSGFVSPPGQRMMRPNFQSQSFGQHIRPQNPGMGQQNTGMGSHNPTIGPQSPHMGQQNPGIGLQSPGVCQQNPRMPLGQPQFQNNQTFNGPPNQNRFHAPPPIQQHHQNPQNIQNNFFNVHRGPSTTGPPRPSNNQGQMNNRPPNRPMVGPPPDFFRAPGNFQQRPRFQHGRQQNDKKKKVNKRDLPENNKYYCDSCDRGYKDEDKYKLHCDQHEKCPKEGCTYVAAGKLVQLHIKLQHTSGMAKKIWSLESKEDIQKWIDERKKNFPTVENVAKKKALRAEKIARGEVIEEKYFGKMHRRDDNKSGRGRGRGRDRRRNRGNNQGDINPENALKRKLDDADKDECSSEKKQATAGDTRDNVDTDEGDLVKEAAESLGMFFAAASSDSEFSVSDDDDNNISVKSATGSTTSTIPEVTAAGALGSLMTSYVESDDDSSDEENKNKSKDNIKTDEPKLKPEEAGKGQNNNNDKKKPRQRNRGRQKKNKDKWNPPKIDKSLLEKLLAKEIRQERNKIMQCVHYIVKNNFFQISQNKDNTT